MAREIESVPVSGGKSWRLFLLFLLAAGLGALYYSRPDIFTPPESATPSQRALTTPPPATKPVESVESAVTPPSFDVAYAQPTGGLVVAGRGEPNWVIKLHSNGAALGETKADENGEWVFAPNKPL